MKKRADGRYQQSVYIGTDNNGKQKYRVVYGNTKKEVEEKSNSLKIKLGNTSNPTFRNSGIRIRRATTSTLNRCIIFR